MSRIVEVQYFYWAYSKPVELKDTQTSTICKSTTDVRQGDPLGPMLFSIGIADKVRRVVDKYSLSDQPLQAPCFYDDIFLVGKPDDCEKAYADLRDSFAEIGLSFNLGKSKMYLADNLRESICETTSEGLIALGAPIGSDEFVRRELQSIADNQTKVLPAMAHLGESINFLMMKLCVNTRPVYHARCVNPLHTEEFAASFDKSIDTSLAKLVNLPQLHDPELPALSKSVRTLSTAMGGLGMRSLTRIREIAYYSSWLKSLQYIKQHFPTFYHMRNFLHFDKKALEDLQLDNFPNTDSVQFDDVIQPLIVDNAVLPTQKALSSKSDENLYKSILAEYTPINKPAMGILVSNATNGISSWLFGAIHYNNKFLRISDNDFREGIRLRLLLPVHDDNIVRNCTTCGIERISPYHGYSCKGMTGAYKYRHDSVRLALQTFIKAATEGVRIVAEQNVSEELVPGKNHLRADLILRTHNLTKYIDVKVCSPCSAVALGINPRLAPVAGHANELGEKSKTSLYSQHYGTRIKSSFIPFVLEMTGRLGKQAQALIDDLAKLYRDDPNVQVADEKLAAARKMFMLRLGIILARGNGETIRQFRHNREQGR